MKIAVIGGGSTYSPELVDGLIERGAALGLEQLVLQDPDTERLSVVAGFCRRMAEAAKAPFKVTETADRLTALDGADCVILQLRVGGQQARHRDIQLGLRYGLIGQETTGVGGLAKALRTLPQVLEICSDMVQTCSEAWLINFTNPSGLITEGIQRATGLSAIGLCNIPFNLRSEAARMLEVPADEVELDYVGLNHLAWVRRVLVAGDDRLPELLKLAAKLDANGAELPEELDYPPAFLEALGAIPCSYLRYYYLTGKMLERLQAKDRDRAEEVMAIERKLLEIYADASVTTRPEALSERGGADYSRAAVDLIDALINNKREIHVVNIRNNSAVTGLPADAVVEIPCLINAYGAHPLDVGDVATPFLALMQHVKAYEQLAIEAVLKNSRKAAMQALITHPLGPSADQAPALLDELLEINGIELD